MDNQYRMYILALQRIALTEDGKEVIKYLKEEFMDKTALSFDNDIHKTMFKLGQKELVQGILQTIDSDITVDEHLTVITNSTED